MNSSLILRYHQAVLARDREELVRVKSQVVDLMSGSMYDPDALVDFYCDVRASLNMLVAE